MAGATPRGAAEMAGQAAEAIRDLNHLTLPWAAGLVGPGEVYDVLGSLAVLARRLPQTLDQLGGWLEAEQRAGRLVVASRPDGTDPAVTGAAVAWARHELAGAAHGAEVLARLLDRAQTAAGDLASAKG